MREIKFRAWDSGRNRMIAPGIDGAEVYVHSRSAYIPALGDFEDLTLLQFTGLKDKNGVEIYEGDVLEMSERFQYDVRFEDGMFVAYHLNTHGIIGTKWGPLHRFFDADFHKYPVVKIGNVYENPELLKS